MINDIYEAYTFGSMYILFIFAFVAAIAITIVGIIDFLFDDKDKSLKDENEKDL